MDGRDIPVPQATLDLLKRVGTPTLSGQLTKMGFRNHYMMGVQPLAVQPGQRMVGRARTLRFIPLREDLVETQAETRNETATAAPHRNALEDIGPDEVLVIDAGGNLEAAVVGDNFTRRVKQRGGTGIVIDGVLRDLSVIRTVGLPVFAKGMHGSGINRALISVDRDEPVRCGEIPVIAGDVIVGDEDGVVAIPPHVAPQVAEEAFDHEEDEIWIRMKLAEGFSLHEVYPPNKEKQEELDTWKAARRASA